jgi:hypothetical protein
VEENDGGVEPEGGRDGEVERRVAVRAQRGAPHNSLGELSFTVVLVESFSIRVVTSSLDATRRGGFQGDAVNSSSVAAP